MGGEKISILVACAALGVHAATTVAGDFTIDHALTADERPLVITGDAVLTVAADLTVLLGAVTNDGHAVTVNLESGSKAQVSWFTVRGGGTTTVNFKGGALTDAGGWDTPWFDTVSGSDVALVSVDGNPIRVTQPNYQRKYWNRNRDSATPGRVTTAGSGRCDLLSASLSGTTKLALMLCGCSSSDWGHTGGTYLGHSGEAGTTGYVWCNAADVLPAGDIYLGTANGLSPVELNIRSYTQSVGRLHLQNAGSTLVRESTAAALTFTAADSEIVSAASAVPALSIPAVTVAAGATLTVDHVAVTVASAFANLGTVAYARGGSLTASLGAASDAIGLSATAPLTGATRLVKSGAGAYSYAGDAALDVGALLVNAGTFRLSGPRGTTNRWWRFTIKQCENAQAAANISEMRLLGADLKPADGAAPDPDYPNKNRYNFSWKNDAPSTFAPYNYNFTYQQGAGTPSYTANGTAHGSGQALSPSVIWMDQATIYGCEFTNPYPKSTDPNTWIVYSYRIPEGRPICGYNLRHAWYFTNYPKYWLLESSADGVTWETMDTQSNYALTSTGQNWYNNGGSGSLPTSQIELSSLVKPTTPTAGGLLPTVDIQVASGATFDASLVTNGQDVAALTVDFAGGGTLTGVHFAPSGTLSLANVPANQNLSDFVVPLTFVDASGTENVSSWSVRVNGAASHRRLLWSDGRLYLPKLGVVVFIR